MDTRSDAEAHKKVFDMIKDIGVTQMVTIGRDGHLTARPMIARQETYDGVLWFFTPAKSGKVTEIEAKPEVLLSYADPRKQNYVSVLGHATIEHDRSQIRALWSEAMRTWFPNGADDPDIALVKVDVTEADYWDVPSSTFVHAYGYLKAVTTGKPPNPGDTKHVQF